MSQVDDSVSIREDLGFAYYDRPQTPIYRHFAEWLEMLGDRQTQNIKNTFVEKPIEYYPTDIGDYQLMTGDDSINYFS